MNEKNFLKLGVREHSSLLVYSPPEKFLQVINNIKLPFGSKISYNADGLFDIALIFVRNQLDVLELAAAAVAVLKKNGSLWFAFPSKGSQLETDLSESEGWSTLVDSGWGKGESFRLDGDWATIKFIET